MINFEFIVSPVSDFVFVNKPRTELVTNSFNMQSEFTALQVAIHDLLNELEARV